MYAIKFLFLIYFSTKTMFISYSFIKLYLYVIKDLVYYKHFHYLKIRIKYEKNVYNFEAKM